MFAADQNVQGLEICRHVFDGRIERADNSCEGDVDRTVDESRSTAAQPAGCHDVDLHAGMSLVERPDQLGGRETGAEYVHTQRAVATSQRRGGLISECDQRPGMREESHAVLGESASLP